MRIRAISVAGGALLGMLLVAIGTTRATAAQEFIKTYSNAVEYIAWTEDDSGHLTGQYLEALIDSSDAAKINNTSASFTGVRHGRDVSISFALLSPFAGATWTGTVGFSSLTLVRSGGPDGSSETTFSSGSYADYTAAVSRLKSATGAAAADQNLASDFSSVFGAVRQAASDIGTDISGLDRSLSTTPQPGGLTDQYTPALVKMKADWAKEQTDAAVTPLTCYQKSNVSYDASTVAYDLSSVAYIDLNAQAFESAFRGSLANVDANLVALEQLAPKYDSLSGPYARQTGTTAPPRMGPHVYELSKVLAAKETTWRARFAKATANYRRFDDSAADLNRQAKALPDTLQCSG